MPPLVRRKEVHLFGYKCPPVACFRERGFEKVRVVVALLNRQHVGADAKDLRRIKETEFDKTNIQESEEDGKISSRSCLKVGHVAF